jgi:superfamily II DNA or RNA helicase
MLARIVDNHFIYLDQVTQGIEESLIVHFSIRDPRAYRMSGPWDGWYRRYNTKEQRLALPFLDELKICCDINNIPLEIVDERPAPQYSAPQEDQITEDLVPNIKLELYQVRCLKVCCHEEIGIVSAVTGAGKSELMCGLVKMFRCPTVIITEQIVVLEQIVKRLEARNVVHNNDVGMFCHGHMPDGNLVIVGSIQSLSSPPKPEKKKIKVTIKQAIKRVTDWARKRDEHIFNIFPQILADSLCDNPSGVMCLQGKYLQLLIDYCIELEWERVRHAYYTRHQHAKQIQDEVAKCDLLIVDECDLASTTNYSKLFKRYFNGRRRFGFSGTPFDKSKPVQALFLKENLGNVIAEATREEVQSRGRIIPIKMFMIGIGEDGDKDDARAYDIAMREEMIESHSFHQSVANIVSAFPKDGTLILVDTSPIEPLGNALQGIIPHSKFIFGGTPKTERRRYIQLFESRQLTCLIGSKILKRGLDLEGGVENLIIIGGGGQWSDFEQKVGRAVRVNKRGWTRIFSFFFLNNKYLYKHSRENLKAIVSMGYDARVIIGGTEIDGKAFVKSRFRITKNR